MLPLIICTLPNEIRDVMTLYKSSFFFSMNITCLWTSDVIPLPAVAGCVHWRLQLDVWAHCLYQLTPSYVRAFSSEWEKRRIVRPTVYHSEMSGLQVQNPPFSLLNTRETSPSHSCHKSLVTAVSILRCVVQTDSPANVRGDALKKKKKLINGFTPWQQHSPKNASAEII